MAEKRERRSSSKEKEVSECGNQGEVHGKRVKRRMKGDTKKLGAIASPLVKVVMKEEEVERVSKTSNTVGKAPRGMSSTHTQEEQTIMHTGQSAKIKGKPVGAAAGKQSTTVSGTEGESTTATKRPNFEALLTVVADLREKEIASTATALTTLPPSPPLPPLMAVTPNAFPQPPPPLPTIPSPPALPSRLMSRPASPIMTPPPHSIQTPHRDTRGGPLTVATMMEDMNGLADAHLLPQQPVDLQKEEVKAKRLSHAVKPFMDTMMVKLPVHTDMSNILGTIGHQSQYAQTSNLRNLVQHHQGVPASWAGQTHTHQNAMMMSEMMTNRMTMRSNPVTIPGPLDLTRQFDINHLKGREENMLGQVIDRWLIGNQRAISLEDQQRMDMELERVKGANDQELKMIINLLEDAMRRKEVIGEREVDLQTRRRISSYRNCRSADLQGFKPEAEDQKERHQERHHQTRIMEAHRKTQQPTTIEQLVLSLLIQSPQERMLRVIKNALQVLK